LVGHVLTVVVREGRDDGGLVAAGDLRLERGLQRVLEMIDLLLVPGHATDGEDRGQLADALVRGPRMDQLLEQRRVDS
jgi:hypothetical protein